MNEDGTRAVTGGEARKTGKETGSNSGDTDIAGDETGKETGSNGDDTDITGDETGITGGIQAAYWSEYKESKENKAIQCLLCPNYCIINAGQSGKCGVRANRDGILFAEAYGMVSSLALDPIEKKPLYQYRSGSNILSAGSYGCSFRCPFCQNSDISLDYKYRDLKYYSPAELAELAMSLTGKGNIGIAYTYNEPFINFEFIHECAKLTRKAGLANILVTNGYINEEPFKELLPYIDAMNIDIKAWSDRTYKMVGGTRNNIQATIKQAYSKCHIEITTLMIPETGSDDIEEIAKWLSSIDDEIPYHISRFFPRYKYSGYEPTPVGKMYEAQKIAGRYLKYVYLGNVAHFGNSINK